MERVDYQPIVVQDLINLHKSGELDLNPWYQRRSVWTRPQKSYLVNSLVEQKPIPSIYIRHYLNMENEKSIKEVVDGQQRIRSILEYYEGQFSARHPHYNKPVLYSELSKVERAQLLMTGLSIGYLIGADDADVIEIFGRLNSVSKTLNAQEKRNARFSGEMKQFCLKEAAIRVRLWRDLNIFTANEIARMQEVEFVAQIALNMLSGLSDYNPKSIDKLFFDYDDAFPKRDELALRIEKVFSKIASLNPASIKDTIFSRTPIFFSLIILLDSTKARIDKRKLEDGLYDIDKTYNSDIPIQKRPKDDADFYIACESNMHRIRSRQIRNTYLKKSLGL